MRIGVLIAIERELDAFLQGGEERTEEAVAGRTVYRTRMEGHEVYAVQSGCGEIDAAAGTMLLIVKYGCGVILNFGVAGALDRELKVSDLFVAEKVWHYDFDVTPIDSGSKVGQYAEYPDEFVPMDKGLADLTVGLIPGIRLVTVASGDKFVENREEKLRLNRAGCRICDMESAAIARVCAQSGIKCLSIKCISDEFDGTGADFEKNVKSGAEKAFRAIREVIGHL